MRSRRDPLPQDSDTLACTPYIKLLPVSRWSPGINQGGTSAATYLFIPLLGDIFYAFYISIFPYYLRTPKRYNLFVFPAGPPKRDFLFTIPAGSCSGFSLYLFTFYSFSSAGQMDPFGAWLEFTVYEEGILSIFPSAASSRCFIVCLYSSAHDEKGIFIYFPAAPPKRDISFILAWVSQRTFLHFQIFICIWTQIKYSFLCSYPLD